MPGCGGSPAPDRWQDCTIEASASLLQRLIKQLSDAPPTLVGHSLGGGIVAQAVLDHPNLARSVVFVAPTPFDGLAAPLDDVLAGAFANSTDIDRLGRAAFVEQPTEEDFQRLVATVLDAQPAHIEGALRSAHSLSIRCRLTGLDVPTMLLGGDCDRHVPPAETFLTAAALRRPEVHIWNQVGHVPHWERPDEFVEVLASFALRTHVVPSAREAP